MKFSLVMTIVQKFHGGRPTHLEDIAREKKT